MKYKILFLLNIIPTITFCIFDTYFAKRAYDKGDLELAKQKYQSLLFNETIHKADASYNLGKIAYRQQKFDQAEAYFQETLGCPELSQQLKKQALFDLGNSQIKLQKWTDALNNFEEFLLLEPENEYAQKTVEYIKKILEEQEKQQKEEKNKEKNDQKEQENQNNSDDQDNNDDSENDEKQSDQSNQNQQQEENPSDKKQKSPQKPQPEDDKSKKSQQQPEKNSKSPDAENQNSSGENQQQEKNDQNAHQQDYEQQASQQQSMHEALEEKEKKGKDKTEAFLAVLEKSDSESSKKLLKSQLEAKMQKRHGEKNW